MRRILITGSRDWRDLDAIKDALRAEYRKQPGPMEIVHGDAHGADRLAARAADELTDEEHYLIGIRKYPADWEAYCSPVCWQHRKKRRNGTEYCPRQGHIRNERMVNLGADVCLAFPMARSKGTWGCMDLAEGAGIEVINLGAERTH